MIGKNYKFRGLDMSDDVALDNHFVITDVNKNLTTRVVIRDKQNYHGSTTTPTLASGRLFTFSFEIFGTRQERAEAQRKLENAIRLQFNPGKSDELYPLEFETDEGITATINAQVYSVPKYNTAELGSMNMSGTFELYAPDPVYRNKIMKSNVGEYGNSGGMTLGTKLGAQMNKRIAEVTVNNEGTWASNVRIEVNGIIENPRIKNLTTDVFYGVNRTTSKLVIDNTKGGVIVTDDGDNVKVDRMPGSETIMIVPGQNTLILQGDNFQPGSGVEWTIFYSDSFQ